MTEESAIRHLKFLDNVVRPLFDKGRTDQAAERMQRYCNDNPDLVHLFAKDRRMDPGYCGNFEPGHMEADIRDYASLLNDVIQSQ